MAYKTVNRTEDLQGLLNDAVIDLRELAEEMDEWRSNVEGTPVENTSKYGVVCETAEALEDACSALDTSVQNLLTLLEEGSGDALEKQIEYPTRVVIGRGHVTSRAVRCGNICTGVQAAMTSLEEDKTLEALVPGAQSYIDEITEAVTDVEGVEFPGMFG